MGRAHTWARENAGFGMPLVKYASPWKKWDGNPSRSGACRIQRVYMVEDIRAMRAPFGSRFASTIFRSSAMHQIVSANILNRQMGGNNLPISTSSSDSRLLTSIRRTHQLSLTPSCCCWNTKSGGTVTGPSEMSILKRLSATAVQSKSIQDDEDRQRRGGWK